MFGIGLPELFIILIIALVVLGPDKLPDLARAIGRGVGEFRKATEDLKQSIHADDELRELKDNLSKAKTEMSEIMRDGMKGVEVEDVAKSLADGTFFESDDGKKPETGQTSATETTGTDESTGTDEAVEGVMEAEASVPTDESPPSESPPNDQPSLSDTKPE